MRILMLVGLGGFTGSILRYLISGWVQSLSRSAEFPYGTLAVNVVGCFTIGLLSSLAESRGLFTPETRALLFTGLLGGFTTFSTFANESYLLLRGGSSALAAINIVAHILLGLGAAWLGYMTAHQIWR